MKQNRPRIVVLGLDGATFDIIQPLVEKGVMPTMKVLMENGSWGVARSCFPPLTCPAWFVISTGKNPGKLGIFNFYMLEKGSYNIIQVDNSAMRNEVELWDILNSYQLTTGIFNNPIAFPPKPVNGYMVAGLLAPSTYVKYTYPDNLKNELDEVAGGYEIVAEQGFRYKDEYVIKNIHRILEKRTRVIEHLIKRRATDFMFFTWTAPDRICHQILNKTVDPEKKTWAWEEIERLYQKLDRDMARVLDLLQPEDYLFLISDHGFQVRDQGFYINLWLLREGYLTLKNKGTILNRLGISQKNIGRLLGKVGLKNFVRALVPKGLSRFIPEGGIEGKGLSIMDLIRQKGIDWSRTKAVALPGGIYFNTVDRPEGIVKLEEVSALRQEIVKKLQSIQNPFTGEPLRVKVIEPQYEYSGELIDRAPDIQCVLEDYRMELIREIPPEEGLFTYLPIAHHNRRAIFLAAGAEIKKGFRLENVDIMDLSPTILAIYGIPVPEDMDGRVLHEIFESKPPLISLDLKQRKEARREFSEHQYSEEELKSIEEKMKNLGYLE